MSKETWVITCSRYRYDWYWFQNVLVMRICKIKIINTYCISFGFRTISSLYTTAYSAIHCPAMMTKTITIWIKSDQVRGQQSGKLIFCWIFMTWLDAPFQKVVLPENTLQLPVLGSHEQPFGQLHTPRQFSPNVPYGQAINKIKFKKIWSISGHRNEQNALINDSE